MLEDIRTKSSYPLDWPGGWHRTVAPARRNAKFHKHTTTGSGEFANVSKKSLSVADGVARVLSELQQMGVSEDNIVVSTNLQTRLDGRPMSVSRALDDPGVAVYWLHRKESKCIAVDLYNTVQDNLAAVAATLSAFRQIDRHGGAAILDRAFVGMAALPNLKAWWQVLKLDGPSATEDQIKSAHRKLAGEFHPDRCKLPLKECNDRMSEINRARDQGIQQL